MNNKNMIGSKINYLTVLSYRVIKQNGYFKCKCDCGNIKEIRASHVKSFRTVSCGCYAKKGNKNRKPPGESGFNTLFINYKKNARVRNLSFELSKIQFKELVQQNCYYCNTEPSNVCTPYSKTYSKTKTGEESKKLASFTYNGIDRLDNNIGYLMDNCVPCCKTCNLAKGKMVDRMFIEWIKKTYNNLRGKNVIVE